MGKVVIQLIEPAVGVIELAEGFSVPLTFSVADIRDLSKRKGATSKSIKIPGTKNNNKILNNLFDANVVTKTFDYNKLQKCIVIEDGIVILDNAFIQLIEINNKPDSANWVGNVEYTALIKDDVSTFFTQIDGKMLSDLKLGEYNHRFDASTIISMMDNTHVDGIKYHFNYNNSLTNYNLSNFTPDVFAKTYFDKIIADAGFVYEWSSMTGDTVRFDEVIIPWNGDAFKIENDITGQYNTRIQKTGTTVYSPVQPGGTFVETVSQIDFTNKVYDNNNYFDLATDKYTNSFVIAPTSSQLLNIRMDIKYQIKLVNNEATTVYIVNENQDVNVWETNSGFNFVPYVKVKNPSVTFGINDVEQSFLGKKVQTTQAQGGIGNPATPVYYSLAPGETIILDSRAIINPSITVCNPTNELSFDIGLKTINDPITFFRKGMSTTDAMANVSYDFVIESIECDIEPQLSTQGYGTTVNMNNYIPTMKQSEFISSILNLYNLYVDVDKENDKKLIFRLRDEFYDSGIQKDWSKKLAKNLGTDIKLLPELSNKKLLLTYKQDDADGAMKGYLASTREVYGQVEYTYDSEYVKGEQKKELIFSPVVTTQDDNANYLPFLAANPKGNVKIALNAKQLTSTLPLVIENYPGSTQQTTQYPLIHSWDEPKNASFDLNFGLNDYYFYYDTGSFTNNNMYNLHWRRTVNQINKGKMLTAYFNLNSSDIKNLKLNDTIVINNTIWNINQVIDYQPSLNKPTKVELISVDDSVKLAVFKTRVPVRPLPGSPMLDPIRNPITPNTGNGGVGGNVILGANTQVIGIGNVVGAGASDSIVMGNNNTVLSSFNSFILGNNITANSNDTFYTNNINVTETIVLGPDATIDTSQSTMVGFDYLPLAGGTLTGPLEMTSAKITDLTGGVSINNLGIDASGKVVLGTTGGVGSNIIYDTYANINTMRLGGTLVPGKYYYITDRDIMLTAIKNNELSISGERILNIIKDSFYTPSTSTFLGVITYYGGIYGQTIARGSYPNSVLGSSLRYVIWGGKMWLRDDSGADTPGTSDIIIQSGWIEIPRTDLTYYEPKVFNIIYNFETDYIFEQSDDRGNYIRPLLSTSIDYIDKTDWGNTLIKNNQSVCILNNYDDLLPANITNNIIYGEISNNRRGLIYSNLIYGDISDNTVTDIGNNINTRSIINNTALGILNNKNMFDISDNIARNISDNYIYGSIYNNNVGNLGDILSNSNKGNIDGNVRTSNNIYIINNVNNGGIHRNIGDNIRIENNVNNGNIGSEIVDTTRVSDVYDTVVDK